jgi:hypothetical protein
LPARETLAGQVIDPAVHGVSDLRTEIRSRLPQARGREAADRAKWRQSP